MKKMTLLCCVPVMLAAALCQAQAPAAPAKTLSKMDDAKSKDWLARWEKNMAGQAKDRYCDKVLGEEIGTAGFVMNGFTYGYMATGDTKWIDLEIDWADAMFKRAVKEPDGYLGWPSLSAAGTAVDKLDDYNADSFFGDALLLRPIVLMSGEILKNPALKAKYGTKAEGYLKLAEQFFRKWVERGGWRETKDGGMISVTLPYGLDANHTKWIDFDTRNDAGRGFSHPCNKANEVARWLLAMWDATGKAEYKDRAEKWFKLQRSRIQFQADGTCKVWNYWQAAGPWDYKGGKTKHPEWIHPKAIYYDIDVDAIVDAYEHGLVFTKPDIDSLIATAKIAWCETGPGSQVPPGGLPGMDVSVWPASGTAKSIVVCFPNSRTAGPKSAGEGALTGKVVSAEWNARANTGKIVVQPIGEQAPVTLDMNKDTKTEFLRMWAALAPYDAEIQKYFEATFKPEGWMGIGRTPYYLMVQSKLAR